MNKAETILREKIPVDCIWEDMGNLTNTPIRYVLEAMKEIASKSFNAGVKAWEEAAPLSTTKAEYLSKLFDNE